MQKKLKAHVVKIRVDADEKAAFEKAAETAGGSVSNWMRQRLRSAVRRELEEAGEQVPFAKTRQ